MEELGFFHLNEEISETYDRVKKLEEDFSSKIKAINKPVLYTEGNNTEYLKISKNLFDAQSDYDIESLGGRSDIRKFFRIFSEAKFSRFKILFVFDCDAKDDFDACKKIETEFLKPFIFDKNNSNSQDEIQSGIENLFNDNTFEPEETVFSITETKKDGNVISRKRNLRKPEFLEYIKNNYNTEDSFGNFKSLHQEIKSFFD